MHSRRMYTARLLTISHSIQLGGVCQMGVSVQGVCLPRGLCLPRGAGGRGVYLGEYVCPGGCVCLGVGCVADTPSVDRQTPVKT